MNRRNFFSNAAIMGTVGALGTGTMLASNSPKQDYSQKTIYNIRDFGAAGDGETICTNAINSAIATCHENGGGRVLVPVGVFKSGTIMMKSNVELHLEMGATLLASTEHKDFPRLPQPEFRTHLDRGGWFALIYAEKMSNIAITGFGTIDGNGALQKPHPDSTPGPNEFSNDMRNRPRNILLISCKQVRVEGLKMQQSGMWMQHYLNCEDVIVDRIEVYNHCNMHNDQIDIDCCRRFVLSNSIMDSEDDGITFKSSGDAVSEDVTVTNCVISSRCNAIKMGTGSIGGFRNICINNCVIKKSRSTAPMVHPGVQEIGISGISLQITDGGIMEGIAISNIVIEEVQCPLFIWLGNRATKVAPDMPARPVGKLRNITISNIVAYHTGNICNSISGFPGHNIENVTINNIQLFNRGGIRSGQYLATHQQVPERERDYPEATMHGRLPSSAFFIRHVKGISINNLMFGSNENDPRIPVIAADVERLYLGKSIFTGDTFPPSYALLNNVKEYDIEKPLGWGENQVIKQE